MAFWKHVWVAGVFMMCGACVGQGKKSESVVIVDNIPILTSYSWWVEGKSSVSCRGSGCTAYFMPSGSGTANVKGAVLKLQRHDGTIVVAECIAKERVEADVAAAMAGVNASSTYRSCRMPEPNSPTPVEAEFHLASVKLYFQTPSADLSGRIFSETYLIRGFLHPAPASDVVAVSNFKAEAGNRDLACGALKTKLSIHTDKNQHPLAGPDQSHALIYVIQQNEFSVMVLGGFPTRYGIDGKWVGGNKDNSYFYLPVDPGEHQICAEWSLEFAHHVRPVSIARFQANAGESYFLRARVTFASGDGQRSIVLEPVSAEEGKALIANSAFSISKE